MKNLKLVAAFVFSFVIISCNSDDDSNGIDFQTMTINGEQFDIETGFLEEFGENEDGSYDWDVTLISTGFNIDITEETSTGEGAFIYLDLNTNSASGLAPGTYTFSNNREEFTWLFADGNINFDAETEEGDFFDAESGTVEITGTGSNQIIEVNLIDENGNELSASYSGSLQLL